MNRHYALLASALASFIVANAPARADVPVECVELGPALTSHSCFHAINGPHVQVRATAGTPAPMNAAPIDEVHTFWDVVLPDPLGENTVSYRISSPERAGAWAFFSDPAIPLRIVSPTGDELVPRMRHDVPSCPFLPEVTVYQLEDVRYRVVLGPANVDHAILVIENVDDFIVENGRDVDGDGFGDPSDVVTSMCSPPEGFVPDARDCDDTDPSVHPGASEVCDGIDGNCNGVADDEGLPCYAGVGVCEVKGSFFCPGAGMAAVCDETPGPSRVEQCNGVDESCNGLMDTDEDGLCQDDTDAPRCILARGTIRCGCDVDADCGGPSSGRACDLDTRRCVDGCVKAEGRNGCPPGLACSSSSPASIGACAPAPCAGGECAPPTSEAFSAGCDCRLVAGEERARWPFALGAGVAAVALWRRRRGGTRAARLDAPLAAIFLAGSTPALGCTGDVVVDSGNAAVARDCAARLGTTLVSHSCQHAALGPFVDVVASEDESHLPDVSAIHTTYRTRLVAAPDGSLSGMVAYTPVRVGAHVIFVGPRTTAATVEVLADVGPLSPTHLQRISDCDALASAEVFPLQKGQPYAIRFSSSTPDVTLFIEHMGAFDDDGWSGACP